MQVLADNHGNVIHLGERDCSLQRRHQKLIEEAPAPAVNPELRAKIGKIATDAAAAVKYSGAGTIAYNGDSIGLQFPILAISQDGSSIPVNRPAQQLAALPSIGAPEGGAWLSHFAITYDAGPSPHPYICYNDNTNDGAPTIADVFGDDFGVAEGGGGRARGLHVPGTRRRSGPERCPP